MVINIKFIKFFVLSTVFLLGVFRANAGDEVVTARLQGSDFTAGNTLTVTDNRISQPQIVAYTDKKISNTITLGIDPTSNKVQGPFTLSVTLSIRYMDLNLQWQSIGNKTLTVNYHPANGTTYNDKDVFFFSGGLAVEAEVLSINNGTGINIAPDDIFLESTIASERYYSFSSQNIADHSKLQYQLVHANSRELLVYWDFIEGAEEYDLEWTWVNDYDGQGGVLPTSAIPYNFKNNATRVRTPNTKYNIPLVYESGWILLRYRAIGRAGTDFDIPIEGRWSTDAGNISAGSVNGYTNRFKVVPHNGDGLNWQYSASFAEGAKKSAAVSYYDGTLRNRQSVAKLNTEGKVIAGSVLYDYQGRPAVNVLPSPIYVDPSSADPSATQLSGYIENLNKKDGSTQFNKNHFDVDPGSNCETTLTPIDAAASAGAANYYSDQNPNKEGAQAFLPDAAGFPYVQTEYTNDQTGRVRRQGGLGATHQLGSEHETKYFYSQPTQEDIDVLFGSEAGNASHYKKNAVMDANKQLSVSYIDMHDRVVATALAGQSPAGKSVDLIDLDSYAPPGPMSNDLMTFNTPSADKRALEVRYDLLSTGATYDFSYTFDTETYTDCLPGGTETIASSYEDNDGQIFTDNNYLGLQTASPSPVYSGANSIYQVTEFGPTIRRQVYEFDEITHASVWAQIPFSGASGDLVRQLTDGNGDLLYSDNAGAQPVMENAPGISNGNTWEQIQFTNNLVIGNQYYYQNGTAVNMTVTPIYVEVYTRVRLFNTATYFDDIQVEITNNSATTDLCFDCIYEVTLSIQDECGNEMITDGPITEMVGNITPYNGQFDANCDPQINYAITPNPVSVPLLEVGTYRVYKSLRVSDKPLAYYKEQFKEYNTCGTSYQELLAEQIAAIDLSGCNVDPCEYESLLTYANLSAYQSDGNPGASQQNYLNWKTKFIEDCNNDIQNPCEQTMQSLVVDFYPGGQYATFERNASTGNIEPSTDRLSIFYDLSLGNFGLSKHYTTINWDPSIQIYLPNATSPVTPADLTVEEFVLYFDRSWVKDMVVAHPEYCHYEFCSTNQVAYDFLEDFRKTNSFDEACAKGYLNPTGLSLSGSVLVNACSNQGSLSPDPFNINGNSIKTAMNYYLNGPTNPSQGAQNLWQLAMNSTTGNLPMGNDDCNDGDAWNIFRAMFIAEFSRLAENQLPGFSCEPIIDASKVQKIRLLSDVTADPPGSTGGNPPSNNGQISQAQINAADAHLTSVCEGYADSWMRALEDCGWISPADWVPTGTSPLELDIRNIFTAVCKNGSVDNSTFPATIVHPTGSRSCAGNPVIVANGRSFESIDEVITYFTGAPPNENCSGLLISNPIEETYSTLDNCGCDKLLQARHDYELALNAGTLKSGVNSAADYLQEEMGIAVANFGKLECACNDAFGTPSTWDYNSSLTIDDYWNAQQIASIPANLFVDPALTCEGCITCADYATGVTAFAANYPSFVNTPNYETLLANYLNDFHKLSLTSTDYTDFENECADIAQGTPNQYNLNKAFDLIQIMHGFGMLSTSQAPIEGSVVAGTILTSLDSEIDFLGQKQNCLSPGPLTTVTFIDKINDGPINFTASFVTTNIPGSCGLGCELMLSLVQGAPIPLWQSIDLTGVGYSDITACAPGLNSNEFLLSTEGGARIYKGSFSCDVDFCEGGAGEAKLCDSPIVATTGPDPCVEMLMAQAEYNAQVLYDQYVNDALSEFEAGYYEKCMQAQETFGVEYEGNEHHYTLYYYDQAGNLTQTVPPRAVHKLANNTAVKAHRTDPITNPAVYPDHHNPTQVNHELSTTYEYNAYNQVVEQTTPDGGTTKYFYDNIGRLVASQNEKQANGQVLPHRYSYTYYDEHGRIVEVGEAHTSLILDENTAPNINTWLFDPLTTHRTEITRTFYDEAWFPNATAAFGPYGQQNLRNRISAVTYHESWGAGTNFTNSANYYSYDEHGNVITSIQENNAIAYLGNGFKRTDYTYELISGNIIEVAYQKGEADQFFHRYTYDADNRLLEAETSSDYVIWDRDAKYKYYEHGPLARVETGDLQVQGTDYAYTIKGWLKGVNSNTLEANRDQGKDGIAGLSNPYMSTEPDQHALIARDAFGYSLDYFNGDYAAIKSTTVGNNFLAQANGSDPYTNRTHKELWNGNITGITNTIAKPDGTNMETMRYGYRYDQLNRLKQMDAFKGVLGASGHLDATATNDYGVQLNYDANGNITDLERNAFAAGAAGIAMDNMNYTYKPGTNQLDYVHDQVTTSAYDDIKTGQATGNYDYTEIGELKSDASEQIENIEWTVYGKVKRVTRTATPDANKPSDLEFEYNPMGQRLAKIEKPRNTDGSLKNQIDWVYTYYSYDASGNSMGTYTKKYESVNGTTAKEILVLNEHSIYGSSRLGLKRSNSNLATQNFQFSGYQNDGTFNYGPRSPLQTVAASVERAVRTLGNKMYELTNHLGNVQAVISDRKVGIEEAGATGNIEYFQADVVSASDYYPFGSLMPGRNFSSPVYRYGYQGSENDNEISGNEGSHLTTYFREIDARLGKMWSRDPALISWQSPYASMNNNPIAYNDPLGDEIHGTRRERRALRRKTKNDNNGGKAGRIAWRNLKNYYRVGGPREGGIENHLNFGISSGDPDFNNSQIGPRKGGRKKDNIDHFYYSRFTRTITRRFKFNNKKTRMTLNTNSKTRNYGSLTVGTNFSDGLFGTINGFLKRNSTAGSTVIINLDRITLQHDDINTWMPGQYSFFLNGNPWGLGMGSGNTLTTGPVNRVFGFAPFTPIALAPLTPKNRITVSEIRWGVDGVTDACHGFSMRIAVSISRTSGSRQRRIRKLNRR